MVKILITLIGFLLLNGCGGGGGGGTFTLIDNTKVPVVAPTPTVISSPAYFKGQLIIGSPDSVVYSLDETGSINWQLNTGASVNSSPAISDDGTIYIGSNDQKLYAISSIGTEKWTFQTNGKISSSAALSKNGDIYISSEDGFLYGINSLGNELWKYDLKGASSSSPVLYSTSIIFVGSDNSKLSAISTTGTKIWEFVTSSAVKSSPSMDSDSNIYFGSEDGTVYSLDFKGNLNWSVKIDDAVRSQISIDSLGNLIFGSKDGFIYSYSKLGAFNWKKDTDGEIYTSIAIDKSDQLHFGNYKGVYEIRSQAGLLISSSDISEKIYSSVALVETTASYFGVFNDKLKIFPNLNLTRFNGQFSDFRSGLQNPGRMNCSTTQDIVASFTRFGLSTWGPDPSGVLESKDNQSFSGIFSPEKFENFDFEAELYSPGVDDDSIALIIAIHRDNTNNLHALIATRAGGISGEAIANTYWGLVYIVLDGGDNIVTITTIANRNATLADPQGNWSGFSGGTRIKVTRRANIITAETSLKTNTTFTSYINLAKITFDLNTNVDTIRFIGPQSIGFAAHSQPNARFRRININGIAACKSL
ncbi:MAG: hypothetical protein COB02_09110 [Candidatus Cloacimonadota bacterium]|nr:MAG: hypothetical protein COB02_09110 [Candidatus Cloacimonadota bacterium]